MMDEKYAYLSTLLLIISAIIMTLNRACRFAVGNLLDDLLTILEVFILLGFVFIHGKLTLGWKNILIFSAIGIPFTFALETAGVLGMIPGVLWEYHGLRLFPGEVIPIVVPFSWFIYFYCCLIMAHLVMKTLSKERNLSMKNFIEILVIAMIGGISMMSWDFLNDPVMVARGNWSWPNGGEYYGIPFGNYIGWFGVPFIVFIIMGFIFLRQEKYPGFVNVKEDEKSKYTLLALVPYVFAFTFQSIDALMFNVIYGIFFASFTMLPILILATWNFFEMREK